MDAFLRALESAGVSADPGQVAVIAEAYAAAGVDDSSDNQVRRSVDELPLILRGGRDVNEATARRALLGVTELAHASLLGRRLEALLRVKRSTSSLSSKSAVNSFAEAKSESDARAEVTEAEAEYRDALGYFERQVRHVQSQLLLRGCGPELRSQRPPALSQPLPLLCCQSLECLAEAEAHLDAALVRLSDRLFGQSAASATPDDPPPEAGDAELRRVRDLHHRVLLERGRLAGEAGSLAEKSRRLRAHLDDPERTLSMAKTWLTEAKAASAPTTSGEVAESTTLDSAASAAAAVLAGSREQLRLDRRLAALRRLGDRQARLLDVLQRRRALHDRLLTSQEAELAKLRRLRSLVESGRRRLADSASTSGHVADNIVVVDVPDAEAARRRMSAFADRLSRLRARLPPPLSTAASAPAPEELVDAAERVLALAGRVVVDAESTSTSAEGSRRRLAELNGRLLQVKQRWAAAQAGTAAQ